MNRDERKTPHCPICGEECSAIYFNYYHEPAGCDECMYTRDAWDVMEDEVMDDE